jgi:hypothetical protein
MMMEPPPARCIAGTAYFTASNTPSRFQRRLSPVGQGHLDSLAQDPDPGVSNQYVQTPEATLGGFDYPPATLVLDVKPPTRRPLRSPGREPGGALRYPTST